MSEKKQKMTVFKSDRHEDFGAIFLAACTVVFVLGYMAFVIPEVKIPASMDGKLVSIAVTEGNTVKKGDIIYSLEVVEKKWKDNKMEEPVVTKDITVKADGKILSVQGTLGAAVKKGKDVILVLDHEKGTLP